MIQAKPSCRPHYNHLKFTMSTIARGSMLVKQARNSGDNTLPLANVQQPFPDQAMPQPEPIADKPPKPPDLLSLTDQQLSSVAGFATMDADAFTNDDIVPFEQLAFDVNTHETKHSSAQLMAAFRHQPPPLRTHDVFGCECYVLGAGSFGSTVIATRHQSICAVKALHPRIVHDSLQRGKFREEALLLKRLTTEQQKAGACYVPSFQGFGHVPLRIGEAILHVPFVAMQMQAFTLRQFMKANWAKLAAGGNSTQAASWKLLSNMALGVAHALHWLHEDQHVLHGDLKSSNVWWNKGVSAGLMDFGMAKPLTKGTQGPATASVRKHAAPLKYWLAPECLQEQGILKGRGQHHINVSAAFDWWGFGCLLVELLYCVNVANKENNNHEMRPWRQAIRPAILQSYNHIKLSTLNGSLATSMLSLIESMLQQDPWRRPKGDLILQVLTKLKSFSHKPTTKTKPKPKPKRKHSESR